MYKQFILLLSYVSLLTAAETNCTVYVENITQSSGRISVGVFTNESSFGKQGERHSGAYISLESADQGVSFMLPEGEYALAIYHDVNLNDKLDKNVFKVPSEPYGFSNNKYGSMGRPVYELAKFSVTNNSHTIQRITLR